MRINCRNCGREFELINPKQKFCTKNCAQKFYYTAHKNKLNKSSHEWYEAHKSELGEQQKQQSKHRYQNNKKDPAFRNRITKYNNTPERRKYMREYRRKYYQDPDNLAKRREYMKKFRARKRAEK